MAASPSRARTFVVIAAAVGLLGGLILGIAGAAFWSSPSGAGGAAAGAGGGPGAGAQGGGPGGPGGGGPPMGMPPAQVRLAGVQREQVQNRFRVIGRLNELRQTTVAAEVTGKVVAAPIDAGDPVTAGETVLARIEDTWVKLDLAQAEAEVAAARATLDQSQRDLDYLEQLAEGGAAKPREVADARATVASDQATLEAAQAAQQRAAEQIERLEIHAPFDGWVVERLTEAGQWLSPGSEVARIISRGEIEAVLNVPERLINRVALGDALEVVIEPLDLRVEGTVSSVTPAGGNAARTFPVKVRMDDANGKLKSGMSAAAYLPTSQQEQRLTVPRNAVQFQSVGAVVWMARGQGEAQSGQAGQFTAAPVSVRVLYAIGDRFVIEPTAEGDLNETAQVVIEGAEVLMPGQPLVVVGGGDRDSEVASDGDEGALGAPTAPRAERGSEG